MCIAPNFAAARVGTMPPPLVMSCSEPMGARITGNFSLWPMMVPPVSTVLHVAQHARPEGEIVDGPAVALLRRLRLGAAHDVVPGGPGQVGRAPARRIRAARHIADLPCIWAFRLLDLAARLANARRRTKPYPRDQLFGGKTQCRGGKSGASRWSGRRARFRGDHGRQGLLCIRRRCMMPSRPGSPSDLGFEMGMFAGLGCLAGGARRPPT